ncbi:MAG TPA: UPF0236 family protein [Methylomirabilota bacterium]|nr:UPF0236 family protein [Methylomirabilota bacterium]
MATVAEAIGAEAEQKAVAEVDQASRQGRQPARTPRVGASTPRVWVIEMDGVMVGMQGGGSDEVKVGVIYELEKRVAISKGRWEWPEKQRGASRDGVGDFRKKLWAMSVRMGVAEQGRLVVIGDGAEWIEPPVDLLLYQATPIMDFSHTAARIWAVAGARFGEGSNPCKEWAHKKLTALKGGEVERVIRALNQLKMEKAGQEAVRAEAVRYVKDHKSGMAYDEYKEESLPIGGGAIEGSCKYLVTARCKQAGMRWPPQGVKDILALRCWILNERLDELRPSPQVVIDWARAA